MALQDGRREGAASAAARLGDGVGRFLDSDLWHSFSRSPVAVVSALVAILFVGAAVFAPWLAPYDPFDLSTVDLMDSEIPPIWHREGDPRFLLGTDAQGRDLDRKRTRLNSSH